MYSFNLIFIGQTTNSRHVPIKKRTDMIHRKEINIVALMANAGRPPKF